MRMLNDEHFLHYTHPWMWCPSWWIFVKKQNTIFIEINKRLRWQSDLLAGLNAHFFPNNNTTNQDKKGGCHEVFLYLALLLPWVLGKLGEELSHPSNLKIALKMSKCRSDPQTTTYRGTYYMTHYTPTSMEILPLTSMSRTPVLRKEGRGEAYSSGHERWCSPSSLSFDFCKATKPVCLLDVWFDVPLKKTLLKTLREGWKNSPWLHFFRWDRRPVSVSPCADFSSVCNAAALQCWFESCGSSPALAELLSVTDPVSMGCRACSTGGAECSRWATATGAADGTGRGTCAGAPNWCHFTLTAEFFWHHLLIKWQICKPAPVLSRKENTRGIALRPQQSCLHFCLTVAYSLSQTPDSGQQGEYSPSCSSANCHALENVCFAYEPTDKP